jgi:hypothetical protein
MMDDLDPVTTDIEPSVIFSFAETSTPTGFADEAMPHVNLLSIGSPGPAWPDDARLCKAAHDIVRGAGRCLMTYGFAVLPELTLASGRRADLCAVSEKGEVWIVEVKASIEDFRADAKWPDYRDYCDRFFFAVGPEFPRDRIPDATGLLIADRYHGEVVRPAPRHGLAGARRKALVTRFARAAAYRLSGHHDLAG